MSIERRIDHQVSEKHLNISPLAGGWPAEHEILAKLNSNTTSEVAILSNTHLRSNSDLIPHPQCSDFHTPRGNIKLRHPLIQLRTNREKNLHDQLSRASKFPSPTHLQ